MSTSTIDSAPEVISVEDVSKRFVVRKDSSIKERIVTLGRAGRRHRSEFWGLRDVSVDIEAGTTVGLIGHNGSGKSTLLKVIGGIIQPTSGRVLSRGRIAALLELGAGFHPDLTGRENIYLNASVLGLSRRDTEEQFDEIVAFAGIGEFIDTQVKFYSSGMYVRLAFAVAVHTDPDILLVDEVLAVGDEAFQRKCMDKIRAFQQEGRTIIIVSHGLDQIIELCDRAILLHTGEVVYDGDPSLAVARFRDLLQERRRAEAAQALDAPDAPTLDARVLSVDVQAVGRDRSEHIRLGDDVRVSVRVASGGITDWACAISLESPVGHNVFAVATDTLGTPLPQLNGEMTVEFVLEDVNLGIGVYSINAWLRDPERQNIHDMTQATSFKVIGDEISAGVISLPVEVSWVNDAGAASGLSTAEAL